MFISWRGWLSWRRCSVGRVFRRRSVSVLWGWLVMIRIRVLILWLTGRRLILIILRIGLGWRHAVPVIWCPRHLLLQHEIYDEGTDDERYHAEAETEDPHCRVEQEEGYHQLGREYYDECPEHEHIDLQQVLPRSKPIQSYSSRCFDNVEPIIIFWFRWPAHNRSTNSARAFLVPSS